MYFHPLKTPFVCFLLFTIFMVVSNSKTTEMDDPIELIPVDAGTEDRGALGSSLQVVRSTFQQDHSFEKLYKVVGSEDIYVRKSGGLQAVFRSSEYESTSAGDVPIVPAGTVYFIGEIRLELIGQLSMLQVPLPVPDSMVQAELVSTTTTFIPSMEQPERQRFKFLEDESYRRQRLTSFVLEIVLSN